MNQVAKIASAAAIKISGYVPPLSPDGNHGSDVSGLGMASSAAAANSAADVSHPQQQQHSSILQQQQHLALQQKQLEARTAEEQRRREIDVAAVSQAFEKAQTHLVKLWQESQHPQDERDEFAQRVWTGNNLIAATTRTLEEIERLLQIRDAEIRIEKAIEIRQGFLYLFQELSDRFTTGKVEREPARRELAAIVPPLRKSTCDVVEAIEAWNNLLVAAHQRRLQHHHATASSSPPPPPHNAHFYAWRGVNYCEKMLGDVASFVAASRTRLLLDFEPVHNPLLRGPKMYLGINRRDAGFLQERVLKASAFLQAVAESVSRDSASSEHQQHQQHLLQQQSGSRPVLSPLISTGNAFRDLTSGYEGGAHAQSQQSQQQRAAGGVNNNNSAKTTSLAKKRLSQTLDVVQGFSIAASRIQALFRGFQCRCHYQELRARQTAARIIQRAARRFIACCIANRLRRRRNAATRIQALHRGNAARSRIKHSLQQVRAATNIQRVFRGYAMRKRIRVVRYVVERAIAIQRVYRGYRVRCSVANRQQHRQAAAATRIQALFRGYRVRKQPRFNHRIVPFVVRLQAWFRGTATRMRYHRVKGRLRAAIKLQAWARGMAVRSQVQWLRVLKNQASFERLKIIEERAAICIQRMYRGFDARLKFGAGRGGGGGGGGNVTTAPLSKHRQRLEDRRAARLEKAEMSIVQMALMQEREEQARRCAAATRLQATWRGWSTRRNYLLTMFLNDNATRIQALVRGFLFRLHHSQRIVAQPEPRDFSIADLLSAHYNSTSEEQNNNDEEEQAAAPCFAEDEGARSSSDSTSSPYQHADEEQEDTNLGDLPAIAEQQLLSVIALAHGKEEEEHQQQQQQQQYLHHFADEAEIVSPIRSEDRGAMMMDDPEEEEHHQQQREFEVRRRRRMEEEEIEEEELRQEEEQQREADEILALQLAEAQEQLAREQDRILALAAEERREQARLALEHLEREKQQRLERMLWDHEQHRLSEQDLENAERVRVSGKEMAAREELLDRVKAEQQQLVLKKQKQQEQLRQRLSRQDAEFAARSQCESEEATVRAEMAAACAAEEASSLAELRLRASVAFDVVMEASASACAQQQRESIDCAEQRERANVTAAEDVRREHTRESELHERDSLIQQAARLKEEWSFCGWNTNHVEVGPSAALTPAVAAPVPHPPLVAGAAWLTNMLQDARMQVARPHRLPEEEQEREMAALLIQCAYRSAFARAKLRRLRQKRSAERRAMVERGE